MKKPLNADDADDAEGGGDNGVASGDQNMCDEQASDPAGFGRGLDSFDIWANQPYREYVARRAETLCPGLALDRVNLLLWYLDGEGRRVARTFLNPSQAGVLGVLKDAGGAPVTAIDIATMIGLRHEDCVSIIIRDVRALLNDTNCALIRIIRDKGYVLVVNE